MPKISHSIALSPTPLPYEDALDHIWCSLIKYGAKGAGEYELTWLAPNDEEIKEVASKTGLSRDRMPKITESNSLYNRMTLPMWIDKHEVLISVDYRYDYVDYELIFMGNTLISPGTAWLTGVMGELVATLNVDCVLLKEAGEEERKIYQRRRTGESLLDIILERLRGNSDLGYPSIAILKDEKVDPAFWELASNTDCRISVARGDLVVFSCIPDPTV